MGTTMSSVGLANKPPALPPVKQNNNTVSGWFSLKILFILPTNSTSINLLITILLQCCGFTIFRPTQPLKCFFATSFVFTWRDLSRSLSSEWNIIFSSLQLVAGLSDCKCYFQSKFWLKVVLLEYRFTQIVANISWCELNFWNETKTGNR